MNPSKAERQEPGRKGKKDYAVDLAQQRAHVRGGKAAPHALSPLVALVPGGVTVMMTVVHPSIAASRRSAPALLVRARGQRSAKKERNASEWCDDPRQLSPGVSSLRLPRLGVIVFNRSSRR